MRWVPRSAKRSFAAQVATLSKIQRAVVARGMPGEGGRSRGSGTATIRLRQRVAKSPASGAARVAMALKVIEFKRYGCRAVNASHLVALVRAGAVFKNGKRIERPD